MHWLYWLVAVLGGAVFVGICARLLVVDILGGDEGVPLVHQLLEPGVRGDGTGRFDPLGVLERLDEAASPLL